MQYYINQTQHTPPVHACAYANTFERETKEIEYMKLKLFKETESDSEIEREMKN